MTAGLALAVALAAGAASAAVHIVEPGGKPLADVLAAASPGDTVRLAKGVWHGPLILDRSVVLEGAAGAIIDGGGDGTVIVVRAPGAVVRGLTIRNSGQRLDTEDSGVFVEQTATSAVIEGNTFEGNLIGVYLKGPEGAVVRDNVIVGRDDLRMNERGGGVQLWNTPGSKVIGNDIRFGRDGIFVTTSKDNVFAGNRFRDLRFGVHYMYTNDSTVADNRSEGNHVGYALMYSRHLTVRGNVSRGDRDHGFLLNYANASTFAGNVVEDGGHKCVFIYNSNKNDFYDNSFQGCDIGIHFTAGSERNALSGNAFIGNANQVKYVGTRWLEWSERGRGNYWSDNPAFDLDGDGIADAPYRPNDLIDQVVWTHPKSKLLLNGPAMQVLRWAQQRFPALHPGGVVDSAPLMRPPPLPVPIPGAEGRS